MGKNNQKISWTGRCSFRCRSCLGTSVTLCRRREERHIPALNLHLPLLGLIQQEIHWVFKSGEGLVPWWNGVRRLQWRPAPFYWCRDECGESVMLERFLPSLPLSPVVLERVPPSSRFQREPESKKTEPDRPGSFKELQFEPKYDKYEGFLSSWHLI